MKDKKRGTGLLQRVFAASAQLVDSIKTAQNDEKDEKTIEKPVISAAAPAAPVPAAPEPAPKPVQDADQWKTYKVTGVDHYMKNFKSLASENEEYRLSKRDLVDAGRVEERVYQYEFYPLKAELVQEPDNPVDPKAIKVLVDGQHVGYIKAGSCAHLNKVIRENRIEEIRCAMGGGGYKYITEDYDENGREVYEMEKDTIPFWVHLTIKERP